MTRFDWEAARRRELGQPGPVRRRRVKGITNDQARELAQLQRAAGVPYSGRGMSATAAAAAIRDLKRVCRTRPDPSGSEGS